MGIRRGIAIALVLIGAVLVTSLVAAAALFVLLTRPPSLPDRAMLVLRLGNELVEVAPEDVVGQVLSGIRPVTVRGLVDDIRRAKTDARIAALVVRPAALDQVYWGKVQEIRDAIADFRSSGKPAVAHLEYATDREFYLATACDRIFVTPTALLSVDGLASYELFLRGTLDKVGAYPDLYQIGPYKTATNNLTRTSFTPEHREMAEWLNHDLYEQLVRGIAEGRGKTEAEIVSLLNEGPFLPDAAREAGLVDELAYEDQIDDHLADDGAQLRVVEYPRYAAAADRRFSLRSRAPRIAVLYASGVITSGRSGFDPGSGPTLGSDTLLEHIRTIRADSSVRALVLRIDSPGGSSVASDVIWRELMVTRSEQADRPLVASMSDLAASGGYYIAMPARTIVAQPATLTGSIGIYGGKFVTAGLFEKLGVGAESVASGNNALMGSPLRPYTEQERVKLEDQMRDFYWQFVEKAADARQMTPDRIHAVAEGRVWTGRQARQLGLVDELGGLERAIAIAKQQARIPQDEEVEVVVYPPRRSVYELLADELSGGRESQLLHALLGQEGKAALAASAPLRLFRRGEPLALMPFGWIVGQ